MKPYQLDRVAPRLAPILDPETILVSILAGVELASLRARFPAPRTIIRAMPNLPVRLGKGVIGLHSDSGDGAARALVTGLMATLGHAEWFDEERLFDLVTALAGAAPPSSSASSKRSPRAARRSAWRGSRRAGSRSRWSRERRRWPQRGERS